MLTWEEIAEHSLTHDPYQNVTDVPFYEAILTPARRPLTVSDDAREFAPGVPVEGAPDGHAQRAAVPAARTAGPGPGQPA